jgi:pimeloyl-ACP methyl ester carboxylesterase
MQSLRENFLPMELPFNCPFLHKSISMACMMLYAFAFAKPSSNAFCCARLFMRLVLCCMVFLLGKSTLSAAEDFTPPGEIFPVFDTALHLYCMGEGQPTLLLEAGLGGNYLDWTLVEPLLAKHHQTCAYDRAGAGFSQATARSRTAAHITDELHELINKAGLQKPFILVGHSFGGMMALHYAVRFPADIAGLILLDPMHPDQFARFAEAGVDVPTEPNLILGRTASFAATYALPETLHARAMYLAGNDTARIFMVKEMRWMVLDATEVKAAGYPHLPSLIVLHGNHEWDGAYPDGRMERAWLAMHSELAQSIGAPPPIALPQSGHQLALDAPEAVATAIEELSTRVLSSR